MNHLEQLVSEWLQFRGYFVRTGVQVGPRPRGGYEGELDVVGLNPVTRHLLHIECSLDTDSGEKREKKFIDKFERGRRHIASAFRGIDLPADLDQVLVLQFTSERHETMGGARLVSVRQFVQEMHDGLRGSSPKSGAVPSTFPLLRTLQLAADALGRPGSSRRIIPTQISSEPGVTA